MDEYFTLRRELQRWKFLSLKLVYRRYYKENIHIIAFTRSVLAERLIMFRTQQNVSLMVRDSIPIQNNFELFLVDLE